MDKWISTGLAIALVAVIAILGLPALRHLREAPPPVQLPLRFSLAAPAGAELGAGDDILDAAISPDERQIVFVATTDGTARLWLRELRSDRCGAVTGTRLAHACRHGSRPATWSSFFADGRLKEITIADRPHAPAIWRMPVPASGASWLLDGSLLFSPDARGVIRRLLNGAVTDATTLRPGDRSHTFPMTVGSSNAFVYVATLDDGRRMLRLVENGQERDLGTTSGHGQIVGDALLHVRDGVLLSQRLDPETRQPSGNADARRARCRRRHVRAQLLYCLGAAAHRRTAGETTAPAHVVLARAGRRARRRATRETTGRCDSLPTIATPPSHSPRRS